MKHALKIILGLACGLLLATCGDDDEGSSKAQADAACEDLCDTLVGCKFKFEDVSECKEEMCGIGAEEVDCTNICAEYPEGEARDTCEKNCNEAVNKEPPTGCYSARATAYRCAAKLSCDELATMEDGPASGDPCYDEVAAMEEKCDYDDSNETPTADDNADGTSDI